MCDIVCEGRKSEKDEGESLLSRLHSAFYCYLDLSGFGLTSDTKCKSASMTTLSHSENYLT